MNPNDGDEDTATYMLVLLVCVAIWAVATPALYITLELSR